MFMYYVPLSPMFMLMFSHCRNAQVDMQTPTSTLIQAVPCSSWSTAELGGTIQYLRGCHDLRLPDEYRALFPDRMEVWEDPLDSQSVD